MQDLVLRIPSNVNPNMTVLCHLPFLQRAHDSVLEGLQVSFNIHLTVSNNIDLDPLDVIRQCNGNSINQRFCSIGVMVSGLVLFESGGWNDDCSGRLPLSSASVFRSFVHEIIAPCDSVWRKP